MEKLLLSAAFFLLLPLLLSAQFKLTVDGNAKINGKLEMVPVPGDSSLFIGNKAGMNDSGFNENLFIGNKAGMTNNSGYSNTFLGWDSGMTNSSGWENTFTGYAAGRSNSTGSRNTFVGGYAGHANSNGTSNAFLGREAGFENTDGFQNTFLGYRAGFKNFSGYGNTFVGINAGNKNRNGIRNTLLGNGADLGFIWDSLDRAVAIGYEAKVGCSNCAVIGGTGENALKVGIGLETPTGLLHLKDPLNDARQIIDGKEFCGISFYNNGTYKAGLGYTSRPNENWFFVFEGGIASIISRAGNVGIGTTNPAGKLDVNGNIYRLGALVHSDKRFKQDIEPIKGALSKIQELHGVSYAFRIKEFNKRGFSPGRHLGLIAQEVEEVFPELVRDRPDGYKAVNYEGLIPVLIEGIKEQQEQIKDQQQQIDELQGLVNQLLASRSNEPKERTNVLHLEETALLGQNQPNPFNGQTVIHYFVPGQVQHAQIRITSADGKLIGQTRITEAGAGQLIIKTGDYPAGTYYYSLVLDGQVFATKAMVLSQ